MSWNNLVRPYPNPHFWDLLVISVVVNLTCVVIILLSQYQSSCLTWHVVHVYVRPFTFLSILHSMQVHFYMLACKLLKLEKCEFKISHWKNKVLTFYHCLQHLGIQHLEIHHCDISHGLPALYMLLISAFLYMLNVWPFHLFLE